MIIESGTVTYRPQPQSAIPQIDVVPVEVIEVVAVVETVTVQVPATIKVPVVIVGIDLPLIGTIARTIIEVRVISRSVIAAGPYAGIIADTIVIAAAVRIDIYAAANTAAHLRISVTWTTGIRVAGATGIHVPRTARIRIAGTSRVQLGAALHATWVSATRIISRCIAAGREIGPA